MRSVGVYVRQPLLRRVSHLWRVDLNPLDVTHDELADTFCQACHPIPVPAAAKGLTKEVWPQVDMNVKASHEPDPKVRVRALKSTLLSLANP